MNKLIYSLAEPFAPDVDIMRKWYLNASGGEGVPSLAFLCALVWRRSQKVPIPHRHRQQRLKKCHIKECIIPTNMPYGIKTWLRMALPYHRDMCMMHCGTKCRFHYHENRLPYDISLTWTVSFDRESSAHNFRECTWTIHQSVLNNSLYVKQMKYKINTPSVVPTPEIMGICHYGECDSVNRDVYTPSSKANPRMWPSPNPRIITQTDQPSFSKEILMILWKRRFSSAEFRDFDAIFRETAKTACSEKQNIHYLYNALLWLLKYRYVHVRPFNSSGPTCFFSCDENKTLPFRLSPMPSNEQFEKRLPLSNNALEGIIREYFRESLVMFKETKLINVEATSWDEICKAFPIYHKSVLKAIFI